MAQNGGFDIDWDQATLRQTRALLAKKGVTLKQIAPAVRLATNYARRMAREKTPRASGTLKNSYRVSYSDGGKKSTITNDAKNQREMPYAPLLEFGKGRGPHIAHAFMQTGQEAGKERLIKECRKLIEKW